MPYVKGEFCNHCDGEEHKGSRKVEAHAFYRKVNERQVWLCKSCWEIEQAKEKPTCPMCEGLPENQRYLCGLCKDAGRIQ